MSTKTCGNSVSCKSLALHATYLLGRIPFLLPSKVSVPYPHTTIPVRFHPRRPVSHPADRRAPVGYHIPPSAGRRRAVRTGRSARPRHAAGTSGSPARPAGRTARRRSPRGRRPAGGRTGPRPGRRQGSRGWRCVRSEAAGGSRSPASAGPRHAPCGPGCRRRTWRRPRCSATAPCLAEEGARSDEHGAAPGAQRQHRAWRRRGHGQTNMAPPQVLSDSTVPGGGGSTVRRTWRRPRCSATAPCLAEEGARSDEHGAAPGAQRQHRAWRRRGHGQTNMAPPQVLSDSTVPGGGGSTVRRTWRRPRCSATAPCLAEEGARSDEHGAAPGAQRQHRAWRRREHGQTNMAPPQVLSDSTVPGGGGGTVRRTWRRPRCSATAPCLAEEGARSDEHGAAPGAQRQHRAWRRRGHGQTNMAPPQVLSDSTVPGGGGGTVRRTWRRPRCSATAPCLAEEGARSDEHGAAPGAQRQHRAWRRREHGQTNMAPPQVLSDSTVPGGGGGTVRRTWRRPRCSATAPCLAEEGARSDEHGAAPGAQRQHRAWRRRGHGQTNMAPPQVLSDSTVPGGGGGTVRRTWRRPRCSATAPCLAEEGARSDEHGAAPGAQRQHRACKGVKEVKR